MKRRPYLSMEPYAPEAVRIRLATLLEFLMDLSIKNVRVVVRQRTQSRNLIIAGDWFSAETITPRPGQGYFQTVFTWHAPTVLEKVKRFDRDFENYLKESNLSAESSRETAISEVNKALEKL